MGISVENPTSVCCDNQSVAMNSILPDTTLKKRSNSTAYQFVCEGSAKYELRCARVGTDNNPSELMTKSSIYGDNSISKI